VAEVLTQTALFLVVFAVLLPLHELGHALAALLVGFRVGEIVIGVGGPAFSFRVGRISVRVNKLPFAGLTRALPVSEQRFVRIRLWITVAGGPAANVAVHLLLRKLAAGAPGGLVDTVVQANLTVLLLNLVPFRTAAGTASDGYQLLTVPFWSRTKRERFQIDVSTMKALWAHERGDQEATRALLEEARAKHGPQAGLDLIEGSLLHRARRHEEGRAVWRAALARADTPQQAAVLKNGIAFIDAILGGADDLREAEQLSGEAAAVLHDIPPVNDTRGAVLARLGRAQEALAFLQLGAQGLRKPQDQAYSNAFLALAQAQLGRFLEAHTSLTRARAADPRCELLPEVAALIEQGAAAPQRAALETAPGQVAIDAARAVRRWRIEAAALAFAVTTGLAGAGVVSESTLAPMILALVIMIFPERTGLWAMGAALAAMAFQNLAGFDLPRTAQRAPLWLAPALLVATTLSFWLARKSPPASSSRTPRVIRIILGVWFLVESLPLLAGFMLRVGFPRFSGTTTTFTAFGVALLLSRRRWVKALVVLPAAALGVVLLRGNPWARPPLDAHLPAPGPALAENHAPATVARSHTAVVPGWRPTLSPAGKAYFSWYLGEVSVTDPSWAHGTIRVGDLDGHAFDVAGKAAAFVSDDRLVVARAPGFAPVNELVEIHPRQGPAPLWKKAIPAIQVEQLGVDGSTGEIFVVGSGGAGNALVLRTAATAGGPVASIDFPASKPRLDRILAPYLTRDEGVGLLVARVPSRFEPRLPAHAGYVWRSDLEDDDSASIEVWSLTSTGERRLSDGVANLACPWVAPAPGVVACWTNQLEQNALVTIDPLTGTIERRGSLWAYARVSALPGGRFAVLTPGALTQLDLTAGSALVLALPVTPKGTRRRLAGGALATLSGSGDESDPTTITVYQSP
jgi:tetratricopeptide (TPR) repeat protein